MNNRKSPPSIYAKQQTDEKKLAVVLMPVEQSEQESTIYEKFTSENFDVGELIQKYFEKFKEHGPHQFLTNTLYNISKIDLEFYLPQLCYLLIKQNSIYLERFINYLCSQDIAQYQLITWCFKAYSDEDREDPVKLKRLERLDNALEQSMVQGNCGYNMIDRNHKIKYQNAVQLYLNNLIEMSLLLKTYKPEDRKPNLKNFILNANRALERYRFRNQEFLFCHGITVPFYSENQYRSNMVVRIIENECTCFNTKKRVPYRIVVETVDPHEFKMKQPKQSQKPASSQQNLKSLQNLEDDVMEDFLKNDLGKNNRDYLQQMMDDIVNSKKGRNFGDLKDFLDQQQLQQDQQKVAGSMIVDIKQVIKKVNLMTDSENQSLQEKKQMAQRLRRKKSFLNAIDKEKYEINMKRFTILFPPSNSERTQSCTPKLLQQYQQQKQRKDKQYWINQLKQNPFNNFRYKHKTQKQLTLLQRIKFFKYLKELYQSNQKYQNLEQCLNKIYISLQYDLYEKKIEKQRLSQQQQEQDISFPRKFGPWEELWEDKAEMIKRNSPYQHFESYQLKPIIVKGGDDLRQELMTMQIIRKMKNAFEKANLNLYVKAYEIIVVSASSGFLEFCADTLSIDGLKKKFPACKSIVHIYKEIFQTAFEEAQQNFIQSLAAYSIISYILQIKDRHNGNILIDSQGRIIHIDFGFILTTSPGNINFESAPFKLTQEYVDMMNGYGSDLFRYYQNLVYKGFKALQSCVGEICMIIEVMMLESTLPCFEKFDIKVFRDRFQEKASDDQLQKYSERLIYQSMNNWRTTQYDNFQRITNGIMP